MKQLLCWAVAAIVLSGCGLKGDLYVEPKPARAAPAETGPATTGDAAPDEAESDTTKPTEKPDEAP